MNLPIKHLERLVMPANLPKPFRIRHAARVDGRTAEGDARRIGGARKALQICSCTLMLLAQSACSEECSSIQTEADAKRIIKKALVENHKHQVIDTSDPDTDERIENIRIFPPNNDKDDRIGGQIGFDLRTPCGRTVQGSTMFSKCGSVLYLSPLGDVCGQNSSGDGSDDRQGYLF